MRDIRRWFGLATSKTQNTNLTESVSLVAFAHMGGEQQTLLAEALVADAKERRGLRKAS
jgi:hypothetical protein